MGSRRFEGEIGAGQQAQRAESVHPASATQHLLALQRTAGNQAVARLLAPAAPRLASLSAIPSNPAGAQAPLGNRATGRVLARRKTREEVEATLTPAEIKEGKEKVLKGSEDNYKASLRLGRELLIRILWNAKRTTQEKTRKEVTKEYAKRLEVFSSDVSRPLRGRRSPESPRWGGTEVTTFSEGLFTNVVNLAERAIVAVFSSKPGIAAVPNSEVLWWQYKKVLHDTYADKKTYKEQKRASLAHIVRWEIANEETLSTMRWCQGTPKEGKADWFVVRPVEPELDDFCALLGTPNGRAAGWLLIQHGKSFGKSEIEKIEYSFAEREMQIHYRSSADPAPSSGE